MNSFADVHMVVQNELIKTCEECILERIYYAEEAMINLISQGYMQVVCGWTSVPCSSPKSR